MSHALALTLLSDVPDATIERFVRRISEVEPDANECLRWPGVLDGDGYGFVRFKIPNGSFRRIGAHRLAMLIENVEVQSGLVVDHLCRTRSCCNPEHMRMVTHAENVQAGLEVMGNYNGRKTHCTNGHELFGENLHIIQRSNRPDTRCCRRCRYEAKERYRARLKAS